MKNIIAFFTLLLLFGTAMGQNQLQNVFIHLSTNGDQIEVDVILAGPGAQQIQDLDVTFTPQCRMCGQTIVPMSPSSGNQWAGGGLVSPTAELDRGVIRIEHANGNVSEWGFLFQLGTGTRSSSSQANSKAELL